MTALLCLCLSGDYLPKCSIVFTLFEIKKCTVEDTVRNETHLLMHFS